MERLKAFGFSVLVSALAGCPIYGGSDPCEFGDCASPPPPAGFCSGPLDCARNETCGQDQQCHPGDCQFWGCAPGYECRLGDDTVPACVPGQPGTGGAGASGGSSAGGSSAGGSSAGGSGGEGGEGGEGAVYCGNPDDCAAGTETCAPDGTCQLGPCTLNGCIFGYECNETAVPPVCEPAQNACGSDEDCASLGAGYACVSGTCTAPVDQCFDQTQCPGGSKCADGKCTPACAKDADCGGGYLCDTSLGLCTKPAKPCEKTQDCGGPDEVCVDGACVPRATDGACSEPGTAWVENGCIPDQKAVFVCQTDGEQDACAAGSICLHHSCYISCDAPNETACDNLPTFNQCKPVTSTSGSHNVCGSSQNLGSECDPTAGAECPSGKLCIDGFCK